MTLQTKHVLQKKKIQKTACKKKIDKIFIGRSPLTYRSPAIWI